MTVEKTAPLPRGIWDEFNSVSHIFNVCSFKKQKRSRVSVRRLQRKNSFNTNLTSTDCVEGSPVFQVASVKQKLPKIDSPDRRYSLYFQQPGDKRVGRINKVVDDASDNNLSSLHLNGFSPMNRCSESGVVGRVF